MVLHQILHQSYLCLCKVQHKCILSNYKNLVVIKIGPATPTIQISWRKE